MAGNDNFVNFRDFVAFAENWQKTGTGLAGDFDNSGKVDISDLAYLTEYWLAEYSEYQECRRMDLNDDGIIAFEDFAVFAQNWLSTGVGLAGDFDDSNSVDCDDLSLITDCWLKGSRPEGIWEQFKAALAAGNIDEAVSFFADFVADDYNSIFNENSDKLQSLAADMGQLTLEYRDRDIAVYEVSNSSGTLFFPVVFTMDDNGQWKIAVF